MTTIKKETVFTKLSDLESLDSGFSKYSVTFLRGLSKQKRQTVSLSVKIHESFMPSLVIRPNNEYLSPDKFNAIILELDLPLKDKLDREQNEWKRLVPVRFVTGTYSNREGNWKALELVFKKGLYMKHFFDYDQVAVLTKLEQKGLMKINWLDFPEAIEYQEQQLEF